MNRYYNENPQVTLWRERCEKLTEVSFSLVAEKELLTTDLENMKKVAERWKERYFIVDGLNEKYIRESAEDNSEKRYFNSLPWYKKMFYKFKLDK